MAEKEKTSLYLISIVAIVAIVGLVVMFTNNAKEQTGEQLVSDEYYSLDPAEQTRLAAESVELGENLIGKYNLNTRGHCVGFKQDKLSGTGQDGLCCWENGQVICRLGSGTNGQVVYPPDYYDDE